MNGTMYRVKMPVAELLVRFTPLNLNGKAYAHKI